MTIYFVSRHIGAVNWANQRKIYYDIYLKHLVSPDNLIAGDIVIGTLPINVVAKLMEQKVIYKHFSLEIPESLRGKELTVEELNVCNAKIEELRSAANTVNPNLGDSSD